MRLDETTPEMKEALKEEAQGCKTPEERMAFLAKNGIELTDEQTEGVAGGRFDPPWMLYKKECPYNPNNNKHEWVKTGRTKPGKVCGDWWPNKEERCVYCGKTKWAL